MQDLRSKSFVSGCFATVLRVSRLGGTAPLHFEKNGAGWYISLSWGWRIYSYIMIIVINAFAAISLINELHADQRKSLQTGGYIKYSVWILQASLMIFTSAVSVCMGPKQMMSLISLLNRLQMLNSELNINYWHVSLGKKMSALVLFQGIWHGFLCITETSWLFLCYWSSHMTVIMCFSGAHTFYFICNSIVQFRNLQIIVTVLHIKYSFKLINEKLKKLLRDLENCLAEKQFWKLQHYNHSLCESEITDPGFVSRKVHLRGSVRRLMILYTCLCDLVREVNEGHGLIVLLLLAMYMLHLVCTPYHIITYLSGNSATVKMNLAVASITFLWFLHHSFALMMTVEPCHSTHLEMEQTRILVSYLTSTTHSIVYCHLGNELETFYRHLTLNKVYYSPYKLFTMSRVLVLTIFGSITTYLVIILHI